MTDTNQQMDLHTMFAQADSDLRDAEFTAEVIEQTDRSRVRRVALRLTTMLLLVFVAIPLQDVAHLLAEYLVVPLFPVDDDLLRLAFAPLNSVGAVLSGVLLLLRLVYRRIFFS